MRLDPCEVVCLIISLLNTFYHSERSLFYHSRCYILVLFLCKGYRPEARGYVIYSPRNRPTHEVNKSHNPELKADKWLFTLARIPQGMQKYNEEKLI